MRERLNNDPKVQLIVLGIAAVVLAVVVMTMVMGGGGATTTDTTTDPAATATDPAATDPAVGGAAPTTGATDPAATATDPAATAVAPAATTPPVTPAPATGAGTSEALLPTKGLPSDVLVAYAKNQAVVLVIVDPKSHGSDRLKRFARSVDRKDAAVFVVDTKDVPRYSRITEGVSVSQTPAIVAVRPRKLNDGAPTATVSYGIRSRKSFEQAIDDALYKGGQVPAYP